MLGLGYDPGSPTPVGKPRRWIVRLGRDIARRLFPLRASHLTGVSTLVYVVDRSLAIGIRTNESRRVLDMRLLR